MRLTFGCGTGDAAAPSVRFLCADGGTAAAGAAAGLRLAGAFLAGASAFAAATAILAAGAAATLAAAGFAAAAFGAVALAGAAFAEAGLATVFFCSTDGSCQQARMRTEHIGALAQLCRAPLIVQFKQCGLA